MAKREEVAKQAVELMCNQKNIRNLGIVAHIDHGKCVSSETRLSLTTGENLGAERLFNRFKDKGKIVNKNTEEIVVKLKRPILVNSFDKKTGKIKEGKITHLWKLRNTEPLVEVTLENGRKIKTTKEHKFLILDKEGKIIEKEAGRLKKSEILVSSRKLIHKGMNKEEQKKEFLFELARDKGFYIILKPKLKKILHKKISEVGSFEVYSEIISLLKPKSFYHCVWRGEYRLMDFISVCNLFNIKITEIWNQINWINYRGIKSKGVHSSLKINLPKNFERLYYLSGLFFGDGDLGCSITNNNKEIQEEVKGIAKEFNTSCKVRNFKNRATRIEVGGITLKKILENLFLYPKNKKTYNLKVSIFLEKSDKKCISAFIRGYLDVDGGIEKARSAISVTSRSKNFLLELQLLLYKFDIDSSFNHKKGTLYISGRKSLENFKKIGFSISYKREAYKNLLNRAKVAKNEYVAISGNILKKLREKYNLQQMAFFNGYCNYENNNVGLSKQSLQKILNRYPKEDKIVKELNILTRYDTSFIKIKEIKTRNKKKFVYDFSVDKFHNFIADGFIVHNTTLSDNLIASSGVISEELAGKQCFMDSYELEQERGITINASNISLVYNDLDGQKYLINLIDTPGHVDFGGDVIRAMRAVDGVVVVVDVVEGVMPQTETVIRQALKEYVKPVLFLNKVDRLVNELKVTPEEMQKRFVEVINEVNKVISKFCPEEFKGGWNVSVQEGSVAFGSGFNNWALSYNSIKELGITFKDVYDYCKAGDQKTLAKKTHISKVLLDVVIKHLPSPLDAQKYRIAHIWGGDLESKYGKSMLKCDPKGPFAMMVTDLIHDVHAGDVATGRIYSGTITRGKDVYLVGSQKTIKVQQVALYMGPERVLVDEVSAGNIAAIIGAKDTCAGETIAEEPIKEFENFMSKAEPVITMSIESKNPKDLPKLIDVLKQIVKEDPNVRTVLEQTTGEILVSGMGELHLEIVQYRIEHDNGVPINVSPPIVVYEETIQKASSVIESKTPNKHNKFKLIVEPMDKEFYEKLLDTKITGKIRENKDDEKIQKLIAIGLPRDTAKSVWAINNGCMLINRTRGIIQLLEVKELLIQGFNETTDKGPLAGEKVVGIFVYIDDATLHEDAIHRGPAQVIPAINRGLYCAMLSSNPVIFEPKQRLYLSIPNEYLGAMTKELQNRRARLESIKTQGEETIIIGVAPVKELIGFSQASRSVTQGKVIWTAEYEGYEMLPHDMQKKLITEIRTRKGMEPQPKDASYYMD